MSNEIDNHKYNKDMQKLYFGANNPSKIRSLSIFVGYANGDYDDNIIAEIWRIQS